MSVVEAGDQTRGLSSYLIEIVVAQTVGKIQVRGLSWNRIPAGRRIKPYIHGVCRGTPAAVAVLCTEISLFLPFYYPSAHGGKDAEEPTGALLSYTRRRRAGEQACRLKFGYSSSTPGHAA